MAKSDIPTVGSRAQVMHGTAKKTSGGLTKKDLMYNKKTGAIVSKKKHMLAKSQKHLEKAGWTTLPGKFGAVKIGDKKSAKKHYKKGSKSKTHKGEKDFTTKKSSKVFHRKGHYVRKDRRPFHRGGSVGAFF